MPESYGLLKCSALLLPRGIISLAPPTPDFRRELTLVSKVLQNLANHVMFAHKEQFMLPLNPFLESNIPVLDKFYDDLTVLFLPLSFPFLVDY